MTPEERAARAIPPDYSHWDYEQLVRRVAATIQEAVTAEREACSRLAAVMGLAETNAAQAAAFTAEQHSNARLAIRIANAIKARADHP